MCLLSTEERFLNRLNSMNETQFVDFIDSSPETGISECISTHHVFDKLTHADHQENGDSSEIK